MMRRVFLFALAVALPRLALGEPAQIRVFEAPAHAEPAKDAAVLQTFAEGAQVSVSEEATNGWRKVRLPDGRIGWVEERTLSFPTVPGVAAPVAAPTTAPDLRPRIYVKNLNHLSELVQADPDVGPMAKKLSTRRAAAYTVGGVGLAVSAGFIAYGASQFASGPDDPSDPNFMKDSSKGTGAFVGGLVGAVASTLAFVVIHPKGGDLLDVVNSWNTRHPDRPFTIENGMAGR